jgi:hypothetical protein
LNIERAKNKNVCEKFSVDALNSPACLASDCST